ncbi:MAG: hypothetical protein ACOYD0_11835 [Candidatus Nanopelagicales bacterium]
MSDETPNALADCSTQSSLAVIDAETIQTDLVDPGEPERKKGQRLTHGEIRLALLLRDEGLSQWAIAHRLNTTQATISRLLAQWQDTRVIAKAVLHKAAKKMATRLVDEASASETIDILERIEVLAPKKRDTEDSGKVNVMIGINIPKQGDKS